MAATCEGVMKIVVSICQCYDQSGGSVRSIQCEQKKCEQFGFCCNRGNLTKNSKESLYVCTTDMVYHVVIDVTLEWIEWGIREHPCMLSLQVRTSLSLAVLLS